MRAESTVSVENQMQCCVQHERAVRRRATALCGRQVVFRLHNIWYCQFFSLSHTRASNHGIDSGHPSLTQPRSVHMVCVNAMHENCVPHCLWQRYGCGTARQLQSQAPS